MTQPILATSLALAVTLAVAITIMAYVASTSHGHGAPLAGHGLGWTARLVSWLRAGLKDGR